ncbi:hypothetical protein [Amycolatopsis keratiniphila]|uniref:hypothetical protein n=1 Tax=Amycolatopsis keratiniphila TaxID=129921 RepID=UPI00087D94B8|nr:hypothetical protein [Amycolatopsis keratiniphila]OLZ59934.1 hypothetical protein BS330_06195 [Amycolatopsis keratiniphila subsp. nogabecina]SDU56393.1 hypothetical protein SAMN04489733_6154 [Amycolatopsis keratiniphila]
MTSFFEDVWFQNSDTVGGGGASPAGGQGFTMSGDEMRALLKKCQDQRDFISKQFRSAARLSQVVPPGDEPASKHAVNGPNGVNETGRFYEGHLRFQEKYYTELILRLEKALGLTEEADRQAADATKKSGTID